MGKMYNASSANALGNVIATNFYSSLKADLTSAQNVYSYQGDVSISQLIPFLAGSLSAYEGLTSNQKAAVNLEVYNNKNNIAKSWTAFHNAITTAITNARR